MKGVQKQLTIFHSLRRHYPDQVLWV